MLILISSSDGKKSARYSLSGDGDVRYKHHHLRLFPHGRYHQSCKDFLQRGARNDVQLRLTVFADTPCDAARANIVFGNQRPRF